MGAGRSADFWRILANASRKVDGVRTIERCEHGTYARPQSVNEHVEGQLRALVSAAHGSYDFSHIAGEPGNSEQARLRIQDFIQSVGIGTTFASQVGENPRVHGSRARAHHQSCFHSRQ